MQLHLWPLLLLPPHRSCAPGTSYPASALLPTHQMLRTYCFLPSAETLFLQMSCGYLTFFRSLLKCHLVSEPSSQCCHPLPSLYLISCWFCFLDFIITSYMLCFTFLSCLLYVCLPLEYMLCKYWISFYGLCIQYLKEFMKHSRCSVTISCLNGWRNKWKKQICGKVWYSSIVCLEGTRDLLVIRITHEKKTVLLSFYSLVWGQGHEESVPQNIRKHRVHMGAHDRSL